jgi:hypothetical protein
MVSFWTDAVLERPVVLLIRASPRSRVAAGFGWLLSIAGVLSYRHYFATGLCVFAGTFPLVIVVFVQPSFARFITSISPAPWPPQSARIDARFAPAAYDSRDDVGLRLRVGFAGRINYRHG